MKYLYLLLISVLFVTSCNKTTKPEDSEQYKEPQGNYIFDVKTKFIEKRDITGAKNGTIAYLKKSNWAKVEYTGEDYSVWIKNTYRDNVNDSTISLQFDYELHTPAMFTEGDIIYSKVLDIEYILNNDWVGQAGNPDANDVKRLYGVFCKKMEMTKKLLPYAKHLAESTQPQFASFIEIIFNLIDEFMPEENSMYQKAEAVIVGAECYGQLSEWMKDLENGNYYIYEHSKVAIQ